MQPIAGLCDACAHARRVTSTRGSTFLLCHRSATDPRFPRYPRLPVTGCSGYEPAAPTSADHDDPAPSNI